VKGAVHAPVKRCSSYDGSRDSRPLAWSSRRTERLVQTFQWDVGRCFTRGPDCLAPQRRTYGGFFSLVFASIFVPALLTYRAAASRLVDEVYAPPDSIPLDRDYPGETYSQGRSRMEKMLSLDVTVGKLLSSAVGIFAPLGVSFAAAFIPQLSK
jgi:hypothetical protein